MVFGWLRSVSLALSRREEETVPGFFGGEF